jgi:hypothetical protein
VEYVGYHVAGIHLESAYPSLGFLDCMHIPAPLKASISQWVALSPDRVRNSRMKDTHAVSTAARSTENAHSPERNE